MKSLAIVTIALISVTPAFAAKLKSHSLEKAATMNVAENICGINFGAGPGGVVHFVMLGAAEMKIDLHVAAKITDERAKDILYFVITKRQVDEFCSNARSGRF